MRNKYLIHSDKYTTESVIVGTYRQEVIDKIQRGFENQFNPYSKLKREGINALDYETLQPFYRLIHFCPYVDIISAVYT